MIRRTELAWQALAFLFVLFFLAPLLIVVLFAFTDRQLTNFPFTGPSLRWWWALATIRQFPAALGNSLFIAAAVGLASSVVGVGAALGLARLPARAAGIAMALFCLPLMLPSLVLAVALLSFYVSIGLQPSLLTVILSHLLFTQPFVIIVVYARLASFDWQVVDSAHDLGASAAWAFWTVTLPIIRPTVIGAVLLAVALSLDDFIITFFTIGSGNTLPTLLWGMIRTGLTPSVNAIGTLLIVITLSSTLLALRLTRYRG